MKLGRPGLTAQILLGFAAGSVIGYFWPAFGQSLQPLATVFVRLVLLIIAPLMFSTLVVGIAGSGNLRTLGRLAVQTFGFYVVYSAVGLALGMLLAMALEPGSGLTPPGSDAAAAIATPGEPFWLRLFPSSAFDAMVRNDVLQIVFFSVLFGVAVSLAGEKGKPVLEFCRSLAEVMFVATRIVMMAAPFGVAGAMAAVVGRYGLAIGENFLWLVVTVYLGLGVLLLVIIPVVLLLFGVPMRPFVRAMREPVTIAFATTSSAAAWPVALENLESMGTPRRVAAFVLFTGSMNLVGSTLFIGVTALFLLQVFGVAVPLDRQLVLFGTLFLAGKSVANVPRASLVALAAGLTSFGLSPELVAAGFGLLIGIDPILDMPRTAVNMAGEGMAACAVARWQGTSYSKMTEGSESADSSWM